MKIIEAKMLNSTKKILLKTGITTTEDLLDILEKNVDRIKCLKNLGTVRFNDILITIGRFDLLEKKVTNNICSICRGKIIPAKWLDEQANVFKYGYMCSCTSSTRGY